MLKRIIAVILLAVTVLTLVACQQAPEGFTWRHIYENGEVVALLINFDTQTITVSDDKHSAIAVGSDGTLLESTSAEKGDVYRYTYDDGDITITYPNGATWWENTSDTGAVGGWSGDYDTNRYIDGSTLGQELTLAYQYARKDWDEVVIIGLLCLVIIGLGVVAIVHPELGYELKYRMWFENVEPTEFALRMSQLTGVIMIVGAAIAFLTVLFR